MIELNKIYNEDCLIGMKKIPDKSIDMILCDLPYGTTANHWDSIIPLDKLWEQYERIIKDTGAIVLTAQNPFTSQLVSSNYELFRYEMIWVKNKPTGHLDAKIKPLRAHESVLVFYKKLPTYNPQGIKKLAIPKIRKGGAGNGTNYGKSDKDAIKEYTNYPTSVLNFDSEIRPIHPTQKPVDLFAYLIKTYTNEGETVLDNCMGSGTTAIACIKTKRNFIGFELEEKYWKLANERIKREKMQKRLF